MISRSKMTNMFKKLLILFVVGLVLGGCKKTLAPLDDNHRTLEDIYGDPAYAEGILMNAYTRLPTNGYSFNEVATDDAVTNDKFNPLLNMATGSWSAANNPVDQWNNSYTAILYLNLFLREVDSVNWSPTSKDVRTLFTDRLKGEVYGLRALFMFNLLQAHAGYVASGELMGVPIITEALEANSDFRKPRNTFDQCVQQIYTDLAESEKYLPLDYVNITAGQLPAKYSSMSFADYNRVFGTFNRQRISGRILKAIKAHSFAVLDISSLEPWLRLRRLQRGGNQQGEGGGKQQEGGHRGLRGESRIIRQHGAAVAPAADRARAGKRRARHPHARPGLRRLSSARSFPIQQRPGHNLT